MYEIRNEFLKAKISVVGGELKSLKSEDDKEIIFQGHEQFPFSSPLLFPIVGMLKDNKYRYGNQEYEMGIHGFLNKSLFEMKDIGRDFVILQFVSNEETMKQYPFEFIFEIEYHLIENRIEIIYLIMAKSDEMYASFGFHPAFNCKYNGKTLYLEKPEEVERLELEKGIVKEETSILNVEGKMNFDANTFSNKAMILKHLQSDFVILECDHCFVKINIANYPFFALWSNREDFVCMEPWLSTADSEYTTGHLEEKPDMIRLNKNEIYKNSLEIIIDNKLVM